MKENNAFIGLGTNLGNREKNLRIAIEEIEKFVKIVKESSIYKTEPLGNKEQGDFLNMVIEIETELTAIKLIVNLRKIEHKMGRVRKIKDGPRTIDLDILLYNKEIINQPNLQIPHPGLDKRNFVLTPLAEIAAEIIHPKLNKSIKTLKKELKNPKKVTLWTRQKLKNWPENY